MNNVEKYVEYIKRNRTHYLSVSKDKQEARLGLAAEVGEVLGVYQKAVRKGRVPCKEDLLSELGDVLYYLLTVAYHEGFNINQLMNSNERKLRGRRWDK